MSAAAMSLFMSGGDDIIVANDWRPHPGDPMPQMPSCFVGNRFGAGALSFNQIFDIVDKDGSSTDQALKVCKPTIAARRSLAHEWKMFRDLATLGHEFPAARSHFLQAYRVVKHGDGVIAGIVMEKANGQNVVKTLKNPRFCNVRYVIALLRDVLVGLDVAQRVLGFAHYDLKLDNVMEHWCCDPSAGKSRVLIGSVPQFKIFDFGTAVVYPDPFAVHRARDETLSKIRPEAAPQLAEQHGSRPGFVDAPAGDPDYEYSQPFWCVRFYHMWGRRKGDVFRVLSALCRLLDDHTWPLEDLELVSLLMTVLEHTTNCKRLKARFAPKAQLLRRLYGPNHPTAADTSQPAVLSRGLSKEQSQMLLQQHCQLKLQGSRALSSQGSMALPSPAVAAALQAAKSKQLPQRQGGSSSNNDLQKLEPLTELPSVPPIRTSSTGQTASGAAPKSVPAAATTAQPPVTLTSAAPAAATTSAIAAATAAAAAQQPPTPTGTIPPPSPSSAGGQYTPRRSSDVGPEEFLTTTASGRLENTLVPGVAFVRLSKVPSFASVSATPSAATARTPFANATAEAGLAAEQYGGEGSEAGQGQLIAQVSGGEATRRLAGASTSTSAGPSTAAAAAVPGVYQMVSVTSDQQRKRYVPQVLSVRGEQQQQPMEQQEGVLPSKSSQESAAAAAASSITAPTAATAPAAAPAPASAATRAPLLPAIVSAPFGAPEEDSSAGGDQRAAGDQHACRADNAAAVVAQQPVASAAQQSILGSRKALRGVTAQQLLVEPVVQSLLSKV